MESSCSLGSEKMPIVLDQPENDSNSESRGNFNLLELVHKPSEYNLEDQNFQIELEKIEEPKKQEGKHKKDWNLKFVPDLYHNNNNNKISNFSCSTFKDYENNVKDERQKCKKKPKQIVVNPVNMQLDLQNGDSTAQELFITKQLKYKPISNKNKKCVTKFKNKASGVKKIYKPVTSFSLSDDSKVVAPSQIPIQKVVNPNINPILIVKIDDQRRSEGRDKLPEYLEYSDKKIDDTDHMLSYNFQTLSNCLRSDLKNKKNFVSKVKSCSCYNCPFLTLNKDYLNFHLKKKQKCFTNNEVFHCPGCKNIFYSLTPLRVHLVHDHRMLSKEVKVVLQNIQEVSSDFEKEKSSCVFETNQMSTANETMFDSSMELSLNNVDSREEMEKSFEEISERHHDLQQSCENGKRQTMLESYLDDINNKGDCNLPPSLNHNGSALLENTFNFTAPVSEQLPSIQPPPAHSSSNPLLDQSNLMTEHQNHGFIGMANVFGTRDQSTYKSHDPPHYPDDANMMLSNGNYLSTNIQDIPVINLDENNVEKSSTNILGHDINIEDFSTYQDNGSEPLDAEENDWRLSVEDEDQEEKKKLKKLGVGYRCDINGCKVRLQSEKNIQYHRRCHEGTLYNCPECCKDCSTWVSLSSHLWQAHKIDMELYKCDQCPYKTPSYSRLTNIHRGIHGKARPFLCDICGKGFKTVKQMRNHKNIHKAKMIRMSVCHCEICGRTVADKRQLELHINNTHKKKKPYLCYMCGYASAVKHSLVVHMRRHTGEKPYECEKCDYKTADHNALRRHKMKHTGVRNYKCNHCSYTCIQASTYKVHIKTKHPGLETDIIFSCGQCNFQTLNRGSFLSHTSEHENFNGEIRKSTRCQNLKPQIPPNNDYYGEANRMDLVGPIISERVVETIVDLSGAQTLLEQDDYYDVERITGDLDESQELKFKTSGIT